MRFFYFPFLFFISLTSFAEVDNSGALFRVDTRPPSEVFNTGFSSLGGNDSVRDHSRGMSCFQQHRNSAFISTSADATYAANYAQRLVAQTGQPVYVYVIASTGNIYRMSASLREVGYTTGIDDAQRQSEWIAYRNIPANTILGVRVYSNDSHITPPLTPNPGNGNISPIVNLHPFNQNVNTINQPGYLPLTTSPGNSVSACFAATLYCDNRRSVRSGGCYNIVEHVGFYSAVILDHAPKLKR